MEFLQRGARERIGLDGRHGRRNRHDLQGGAAIERILADFRDEARERDGLQGGALRECIHINVLHTVRNRHAGHRTTPGECVRSNVGHRVAAQYGRNRDVPRSPGLDHGIVVVGQHCHTTVDQELPYRVVHDLVVADLQHAGTSGEGRRRLGEHIDEPPRKGHTAHGQAAVERIVPDARHAVRHLHVPQVGAAVERAFADARDRVSIQFGRDFQPVLRLWIDCRLRCGFVDLRLAVGNLISPSVRTVIVLLGQRRTRQRERHHCCGQRIDSTAKPLPENCFFHLVFPFLFVV